MALLENAAPYCYKALSIEIPAEKRAERPLPGSSTIQLGISFQDCGGSGSGSVPSWAQRANEPLVPELDLSGVKRDVQRDLKEIKKASEEIARLRKKSSGREVGSQLLSISEKTRERARGTSKRLRDALAVASDGSADHQALTQLSDEFRATLKRFQQEAEAAAPAPTGGTASAGGAGPSSAQPADIEVGGGGGSAAPTGGGAAQEQAQLQAAALNDSIIAEREEDINNIHRTVHEVAEIFQDLALLVDEQGTHIDNIQTNIESAGRQVDKGVQQLARASRSQKKNRARLCFCAAFLITLLIVGILILHFAVHAF